MTAKQAVTIVSRAFALYLLVWALDIISYLPTEYFSLVHHATQQSVLAATDYFHRLDQIRLSISLVRLILLLCASYWFYKCSPRIAGLFLPQESADGENRA